MLVSIPAVIRVPLVMMLIAASTVAHTLPLFLVALLKWLVPLRGFREGCAGILIRLAESWIAFNTWLIDTFTPTRFEVEGLQDLHTGGHYLVLSNHQSWVDILVMQKVFNRRIPFMRFFLKSQLIWVPLLGLAWWSLDFPFMRRYTRKELAKRPDLAGKDIIATRRACEKFQGMPVSIMNFVEGTRLTPEKHRRQSSPYARLLKPKAGGVAFVMDAMGNALHSVIDVTIGYPGGAPSMMDLVAGRIPRVQVHVRQREIPPELLQSSYESDSAARVRFQRWVNRIWVEKDQVLAEMAGAMQSAGAGLPPPPSMRAVSGE